MTWQPFLLPPGAVADPEAVVVAPGARFTVLTSRLLRLEWNRSEHFEDRPSQVFWVRRQPVPPFRTIWTKDALEIMTDHLRLRYLPNPSGFTAETLSIELLETGITWRYGEGNPGNLLGTARTLDLAANEVGLEPGLISRAGWSVVDDSRSLVFNREGWLQARSGDVDVKDLYFFGYGDDYAGCLRDFSRVSCSVPLLPRWALGNWWSRYWPYSQDELRQLMEDFRAHQVPLSVCIIDMDWHLTETGNDCSGWTGYTWNRALFPEPEAFIDWLHEQGLKTALNVHPAEGVHCHEAAYAKMAEAIGVDPETKQPVKFAIHDPRFAKAYFELLHHPLEEQGVDFWWIDWQQGNSAGLPGLDPLWWLNHLHFWDRARDGRRPFTFSRWGGLGNHRYPIGFSGDTHVTWEALAFQPYFTATAANVGYGWWSHDIGGHMYGIEDPELYVRWVQFGVFSPILRLHSTHNPYHERRPWGYDAEVLRVTREALQMRHALIPYLYSMSWRHHKESIPPLLPMYYTHPKAEEAYLCPDQYWFGSELVAAPNVSKASPELGLSRQVVWLPEGDWFGFSDGAYYPGGWHTIYSRLDETPIFARAGGIVPLGPKVPWGGVEKPDQLDIYVFPGAANTFELYEDAGDSVAYTDGEYCLTPMCQVWRESELVFLIEPAKGDSGQAPSSRKYRVHFRCLARPDEISVRLNGQAQSPRSVYDEACDTLSLSGLSLSPEDRLEVVLSKPGATLLSRRTRVDERVRKLLRAFRLNTNAKAAIERDLPEIRESIECLGRYLVHLSSEQLRALVETIAEAGAHQVPQGLQRGAVVLWNRQALPSMHYALSIHRGGLSYEWAQGPVPAFLPVGAPRDRHWRLWVDYCGLAGLEFGE